MLEKLKTRLVITRKNAYARVPLATMLTTFVIADKTRFESEALTAIKWSVFGAVITILLIGYVVLALTEKEVDIFDTKLLEKKGEAEEIPTKEPKSPFHFFN